MALNRIYSVAITRVFPPADLAALAAAEADRGEEDGLAGNQHYQDLRGASWQEVAHVVAREAELFARFEATDDLDEEAELFDEERQEAIFPEEDLCGLDIGVAGTTLALSALGAVPVSSCNAGGFGGHHVAQFPYVAFFIGDAAPAGILRLATDAGIGLDVVEGGIGRVFGRTDRDLHRFAEVAIQMHPAKD